MFFQNKQVNILSIPVKDEKKKNFTTLINTFLSCKEQIGMQNVAKTYTLR